MSKHKKRRAPAQKRSTVGSKVAFLTSQAAYDTLCVQGYTSLDKSPEVITACRKIADVISAMTIHLMANTELGDRRVVNELSRAVDIYPNRYMTRKTWMDVIVMNLLLYGAGNSIVQVHTSTGGYLGDLEPIAPSRVLFKDHGSGYKVLIDGVEHDPDDDLLHFVHNPDPARPWKGRGLSIALRDVANNLKQATATEKGFMESKWKPSIVVKVDGMADAFAGPDGRKRLLNEYIASENAGEPWLIPADQFSIEQVRPLSLADLAISEVVELDKRTVASVIGVPPFVLGVGEYNADAWNAFVNNTVRPIAREIEQELTRKLLISQKMYWRFNMTSLYSYDIKTVAEVYSELRKQGIVTGNEVRDKLGMPPLEGLDTLVLLENYISLEKIDDQLKLNQGEV